ncbi:response regulator transcription factor [Streptomyces fuscichromogenes]|uniref:DNA-binding response regulator n=1 Tax=Streptomyces fuscichromogenes TaxID=1324013 RepID=A0A918CQB1_9ACTN|nr:response regulator transcription factor [Streptomyces fuscichromogenes]GGN02158.1 DNA-binding response regulator [Streptomyces fuscichromogenes]
MRVLLVEDDPAIAEPLERGLKRYGYTAHRAATGRDALRAGTAWDMVLLDLGLPDIDGLDVCRQLRADSDVPLIMISARDSEADKVVGLELGADDYLVKPFLVRELIARMRAVQRRRASAPPPTPGPFDPGRPGVVIDLPAPGRTADRHGRVVIDRQAHRAFLDGSEVALPPREFALLAFLAEQPEVLVTRETIMSSVWDANWFGPTKTLDTHVSALRHKFGDALTIEAVRGVGFRLSVGPRTATHSSAS